MTVFLGFMLLLTLLAATETAEKWWQYALFVLFGIFIAGLMMLSYWDWRP